MQNTASHRNEYIADLIAAEEPLAAIWQSEFDFHDQPRSHRWAKLDVHNAKRPQDLPQLIEAARDAVRHFGGWTIHMARDIAKVRHGRSVSRSLLPGYARDIAAMCPDLPAPVCKKSSFGEGRPRA